MIPYTNHQYLLRFARAQASPSLLDDAVGTPVILELGCQAVDLRSYLEGQGDLASGLIRGITWVVIWVARVMNLLTKSP